jgi:tellurite resistance protein TehA-like permease
MFTTSISDFGLTMGLIFMALLWGAELLHFKSSSLTAFAALVASAVLTIAFRFFYYLLRQRIDEAREQRVREAVKIWESERALPHERSVK